MVPWLSVFPDALKCSPVFEHTVAAREDGESEMTHRAMIANPRGASGRDRSVQAG
jgi:hypothetical protein